MIITKTPYRISFFGGGSDYPEWFNKYYGEVISTTINKYLYISRLDGVGVKSMSAYCKIKKFN